MIVSSSFERGYPWRKLGQTTKRVVHLLIVSSRQIAHIYDEETIVASVLWGEFMMDELLVEKGLSHQLSFV